MKTHLVEYNPFLTTFTIAFSTLIIMGYSFYKESWTLVYLQHKINLEIGIPLRRKSPHFIKEHITKILQDKVVLKIGTFIFF
jgi:hypothetical protein